MLPLFDIGPNRRRVCRRLGDAYPSTAAPHASLKEGVPIRQPFPTLVVSNLSRASGRTRRRAMRVRLPLRRLPPASLPCPSHLSVAFRHRFVHA